MIYAIDFDGTIVEEKFPEIGALKPEAAEFIRHIRQNGDKWILYTMRGGQHLEDAVAFLIANDLIPDAINDNLPEVQAAFAYNPNPRKVFANFYIDDHNMGGLRFSEYKIGDKIKFQGSFYTVVKTKPGKVLMKDNFCQKWFDIEEIKNEN
jgi:hypothetical protein